jgi:hypothetical protein
LFSHIFLNVWIFISRLWKKNIEKSCFQAYPRKIAIKTQRIDQSRKLKKIPDPHKIVWLPNAGPTTGLKSTKSRLYERRLLADFRPAVGPAFGSRMVANQIHADRVGSRFLVKVSLCQISALKLFPVTKNLVAKPGPLGGSTGGCRGADDQRKKLGLDFGLTKTCIPSFIQKYWL